MNKKDDKEKKENIFNKFLSLIFKRKKDNKDDEFQNIYNNYYNNNSYSNNYYNNQLNSSNNNSNDFYNNNNSNSYYNNNQNNYYNNQVNPSNNNSNNFYNNKNSNSYYNDNPNNYYTNQINSSNNNSNNYYSSDNKGYYGNQSNNFYAPPNMKKEYEIKEENTENSNNKKILIIVGLLIVLFVSVIALVFLLFSEKEPDINLLVTDINLKVGENKYISYEMINVTNVIDVSFSSSDTLVATVDNNGNVTGINGGNATIYLKYRSGNKNKEKTCNVTVEGTNSNQNNSNNTQNNNSNSSQNSSNTQNNNSSQSSSSTQNNNSSQSSSTQNNNSSQSSSSTQNNNSSSSQNSSGIVHTPAIVAPSLSLSLSNNSWSNENVTVSATAKSNSGGNVSLKYAINCSQDCTYKSTNGLVVVSNNGTNIVTVIATDSLNERVTEKSVIVKIDKTKPTMSLINGRNVYEASTSIEICAKCTDSESGCQKEKVCKIFTSSASNQTIEGKDNAGNIGTSPKFNIVINKPSYE